MKNPFSISFGRVPNEYTHRSQEKEKILDALKFNQYRRRLRDRGLIDVRTYGQIRFYLPIFREFLETEVFEAFELT